MHKLLIYVQFLGVSVILSLFLHIIGQEVSTIFGYITISWLYWTLVGIYITTILSIIAIILSENRNPVKSLAWITVLLLLPAFGIVLYIFFGRSIKNKHMISRRKQRRLRRQGVQPFRAPLPEGLSEASRQQIRLARSIGDAHYYPGNDIEIFCDGSSKFDRLLADLENACTYINLQYYIISNDEIGRRVADVLMRKAGEGVKVRVIYDHIGSIKTRNRFFRRMRRAGVEIYPFFRVVFPIFGSRVNWRNHRKICIIDGEIGYIGGMNIADRYIHGPAPGKVWRDTHLRVKGSAVAALQYSFAVDWNFMGNGLIDDAVTSEAATGEEGAGVQMVTSGPTSRWSEIEYLFFKAIGNARRRIFIQTPYFLPTDALLKALKAASLARVDVRIMIPRKSDSAILTAASASYVTECLNAGIKVYLFEGGMLHSKTLLVDDEFCSVGSTNFDFRSFEHNFEGNLMIYSRDVNARMADCFRDDMQQSCRLSLVRWKRRSLAKRTFESLVRLLSPVL